MTEKNIGFYFITVNIQMDITLKMVEKAEIL